MTALAISPADPCPWCQGTGGISNQVDGDWDTNECLDCNGTGVRPQVTSGECCMLGCHDPVAETQVVDTVIDGQPAKVTYLLCQGCGDASRAAAQRHTLLGGVA